MAVTRNFVVNCPAAKRLIVQPQRTRARDGGQSVLDHIIMMLKRKSQSDTLFASCMEVLKVLALSDETRATIIKVSSFDRKNLHFF